MAGKNRSARVPPAPLPHASPSTNYFRSFKAGSIAFRLVDTTVRNILLGDIVKLQSSKASIMPDGLEALFTPQSLADLIAYLKVPK